MCALHTECLPCALCEPKCLATSKCSARYISSLRSKQGTVSLCAAWRLFFLKAKRRDLESPPLLILPSYEHSPKPLFFCRFLIFYLYISCWLFLFFFSHHQLTKAQGFREQIARGITASSSFEIQPVFLHLVLLCSAILLLWLLKLKDPKELVRSCQLMVFFS